MAAADDTLMRHELERLAAIDRPSASAGELRAAEMIMESLSAAGCHVYIQKGRAAGNYWWPLTALSLTAVAGAALASRGRRRLGWSLAAAAAAGVWDDLSGGAHWARKLLYPRGGQTVSNVVAHFGPRQAKRQIVLVAHHDAARSGLIFHPALPRLAERIAPALKLNKTSPPLMFPVFGGPLLTAIGAGYGSRKLLGAGAGISALSAAVFLEIASRDTVPGANDNLTGVVCLTELARRLASNPPASLEVVLVSTGAEESFMEGMRVFMKRLRHRDIDDTFFLCVDTVGSDDLCLLDGEGMLRMREYPPAARHEVSAAASDQGIDLIEGVKLRNATDGLYPLKEGYPSAMLGSVSEHNAPANYHWPTDTPENVNYATVGKAVEICHQLIRRLDAHWI